MYQSRKAAYSIAETMIVVKINLFFQNSVAVHKICIKTLQLQNDLCNIPLRSYNNLPFGAVPTEVLHEVLVLPMRQVSDEVFHESVKTEPFGAVPTEVLHEVLVLPMR